MWNYRALSACRQRLNLRLFLPVLLTFVLPYAAQGAAVPTTTTLVLSSSTVASPALLTLTASVTGGGAPITEGTVIFCDTTLGAECQNSYIVGTAQLNGASATLKIVPAIGVHTYVAKFSATATEAASTSTAQTLTVTGKNPTSTTLVATGNPEGYGLTATVTGMAGRLPLLSGTVSFQDTTDGDYVLGTGVLGAPVFGQSFSQPNDILGVGNQPSAVGVGDFNGDGWPDLAVVLSEQSAVQIMLSDRQGGFTLGGLVPGVMTAPCSNGYVRSRCSIAVGDFNHDGRPDLAITSDLASEYSQDPPLVPFQPDNRVYVLMGNADGTFTPAIGSPISVGSYPEQVNIGDFNSDGLQDLVVANGLDNTLSILLGNGDGTFAPQSTVPVGNFPFYLAVADFRLKGASDIAVTNVDDSTVSVLWSNGDGTFTEASGSPFDSGSYAPGAVVAADFDKDGYPDLAVANYTPLLQHTPDCGDISNVVILRNHGDGTFTSALTLPVGLYPVAMVAADFNQDGNTDLAVDNGGDNSCAPPLPETQTLTLLLGDGKGGFAPPGPATPLGNSPYELAAGDFNGDGTTDLAIPDLGSFSTRILLNQLTQTETASVSNITIAGSGTHYADAVYLGSTYFARSTSNNVALQGKVVPTLLTLSSNLTQQLVTMPVTFTTQLVTTVNPGPTESPTGSITFMDGSTVLGTAPLNGSGQAVFTTSSLGDGVHSITATYGGDPSYLSTTSNAVSVTISDLQVTRLDKISPIVLPGTTVTYSLQVAPQVASTFLYSVALSTSGLPAGATATISPASVAAAGGTTKFTLTIKTAGATASNQPPASQRLPLTLGLLLPIFGAIGFRKRLRGGMLPLLLLVGLSLSAVAGLSGCSGAGLFAARKVGYTVTVTATEGTLQRSIEVPLAIQ
jgi:hypothetical protein